MSALEELAAHETAKLARLQPVDLSGLAEADVDPTRYAVEPILPRQHVTLLGSHGGAGKSILALTLAAHVVCGRAWCGLPVYQGKALYVSLEDPGELVRYRLRRIADEYDLDPATISEGLTVLDGSMGDAVLATEVNDSGTRRLVPTAALEELEQACEGMSLAIVDNASDAYDANENDRRMVRRFVRSLAHIAREHDAAVLLLAHIDKAAARTGANGNTYSGSTAWHNSTRSRLALSNQDGVELAHEKHNLGSKIEPIALTWTDTGVLVPVSARDSAGRDAEDDAAVLAAIMAANADGHPVYAARTGPYTALTILRTYPDLPAPLQKDKQRFWQALTRLERDGRIYRETYRTPDRKQRVRLLARPSIGARQSPTPPSATTARMGRADCASRAPNMDSGIGALAHCPKCDGEGCKWCKPVRRTG